MAAFAVQAIFIGARATDDGVFVTVRTADGSVTALQFGAASGRTMAELLGAIFPPSRPAVAPSVLTAVSTHVGAAPDALAEEIRRLVRIEILAAVTRGILRPG